MYPAFVLVSETFQHDQPYHDAIYPLHWTQAGRDDGTLRFRETKNSQPNIRFIKAVDKSTGEMAGLVRYYIYEKDPEEEDLGGDWWSNCEEKAYAQHLYKNYLATRYATVKSVKGPVVCLDLLTVHPNHQSHGAGTALVKWGIELAAQMGAEMTVESSFLGLEVYKKNGFQVIEERTLPVPAQWDARPKTNFWFMRREVPQPEK